MFLEQPGATPVEEEKMVLTIKFAKSPKPTRPHDIMGSTCQGWKQVPHLPSESYLGKDQRDLMYF